jgi:hypothetical protein
MKNFWKLYKRSFTNYWMELNEAAECAVDMGAHLLVLTFPLTFPVLYPLVMLWQKAKSKWGSRP